MSIYKSILKNNFNRCLKHCDAILNSITLKELTTAYRWCKKNIDGCRYWYLFKDNNFNYALVMGSQDFGDHYETCIKLAREPYNNAMRCDYDSDWLIPEINDSGDLVECDFSILTERDIFIVFNTLKTMTKIFFQSECKYNKKI